MKSLLWRVRLLALLTLISLSALHAGTSATRLRCEYRVDPAGIGETEPRLSWIIQTDEAVRGTRQSAYQILVASSPELLANDKGDLWDSGKVSSDAMQIEYAGKALTSRQGCYWKVRIWDETGVPSTWSNPAQWSIGLLADREWQAQWIGFDERVPGRGQPDLDDATRDKIGRQPWVYADVPESKAGPLTAFFRSTFTISAERKPVEAILAIVPDQRCVVTLNKREVARLTRWHQLLPINITGELVNGTNVIGIEVAQLDGHPPALLGSVLLRFPDQSTETLAIDTSWRFSMVADADWTGLAFNAGSWKPVIAPPQKRNPWDGPPQTFTYNLPPAPLLRKNFAVTKPVRRATVYSTALGAYELHMNGQRVGQDYLTPGWTDFNKRVQYQTYDVTSQLRTGENVIGAILGDGWYASVLGYTGMRYFYGGYPRFLAQLEIEYRDGSRQTIATDNSWRATAHGPILSADLMQGCEYDSSRAIPGWATAEYNAATWKPVAIGMRPTDPKKPVSNVKVEAANAEPSRISETIAPRQLTEPSPGSYVFDLGQNIVGWVRLKIHGRENQRVTVRHGEMLNPNGTLYTSNLRGANATDSYVLRGGDETLEPAFTFHGFRYVEVTGLETKPTIETVTGVVVHSAMERTGTFECSSPLLNQLFQNIIRSQKGNYLEVPTDCPQRDERAGWSGDAQFFIRTGTYNFDVATFMARWLTTLAIDSQLPDGSVANVAPAFSGLWASPGWGGDAVITCVHELYRTYGDTRVIARNYDSMSRYLAWLAGEKKPGGVRLRELGDHLNLGGGADLAVLRVAHIAHLNQLMAEMAAALGKTEDAARYTAAHAQAKAEFQRELVLSDGSIRNSSQTGYALAFTMGLLADEAKPRSAEKFVDEIRKTDWHLATGFIGTPRLLPALHLAGRDDVAFKLLLQETYPSWLFQVKNGATTIWERWDGWTPEKGFQTIAMNSFNHYAFGSVGEFLYRQVAGIDAGSPGFRTIVIRPAVGHGLTWARASYDSVSGHISSAWKLEGSQLTLDVEIPANTTATVYVPTLSPGLIKESGRPAAEEKGVVFVTFENNAAIFTVGSGKYKFLSAVDVR